MSEFLLAVDIGNSEATLGLFESQRLRNRWRLHSRISRSSDEIWAILSQFLVADGVPWDAVKGLSIASVVPERTESYLQMAMERLRLTPLVIDASNVRILKVDYTPPSAVGPDRLCGAAAAFQTHGGPVIVIDLGTATVFDVVTADGTYRGGLIAPGIRTAANSLRDTAAMLPRVDVRFPDRIIGQTTETSIQSGILNGAVAMVDGLVGKIQAELGGKALVVATGGFSSLLKQRSETIGMVDPDLVLQGIRIITESQPA